MQVVALLCTKYNRRLHVFKLDWIGQFVENEGFHLRVHGQAPLVLSIYAIFSFFNLGFIELLEVVVCILDLLLLNLFLANESKGFVRHSGPVLVHKLVNSALYLGFVLLVNLVYCLFNKLVLCRISIGCMLLFNCSEVAHKTPRWH